MKIIKLLPLFLLNILYVDGMENNGKKLSNISRINSSPGVLEKHNNEDYNALRQQLLNARTEELAVRKQELALKKEKFEWKKSLKKEEFEWKKSIIKLVKQQLEKGADVTCKMGDIDIQVMQQLKY